MLKIGDKVCLAIDKSKVGIVMLELSQVDGVNRYKVFHGPSFTDTCDYYENQLELISETSNVVHVSKNDFISYYTAKKLELNSKDSIFSLNAGKVNFIPFQYRPLTKILKAERPRLLIADDVGVGKTIETGLIIKEFEKRDNISKIIIICPKELTTKWHNEMKNKFDENFFILSSENLSYCLRELEFEGEWPREYSKCILGLEMLRRKENIDKINSIDVSANFNMLIVDEAHHVSDNETNSYNIVEYFCENSEIAVFLSATPLQLGSNDLFSLLNLLLPEEFESKDVFEYMRAPNEHINSAIRALRSHSDINSLNNAFRELNSLKVNDWAEKAFSHNSKLNYWLKRLSTCTEQPLSAEERILCLNDIESLNTLSHIINRTRRKDIQQFTIREPQTVKTAYNEAEWNFYKAVVDYKRSIYSLKYNPAVISLIMTTTERMITSSLPAFANMLLKQTYSESIKLSELIDDIDMENENVALTFANNAKLIDNIKELAEKLPQKDSKAEELIKIVRETANTEPGKLIVFSFFKNTLKYLSDILKDENVRVAVITGATKHEERDRIRASFRLPKNNENAIDVLLCSEVGCEGLDYEFCNRMVNYDIPWNPMKIEQRIGRIDRYGQKSPKVQIFNFITDGTVEERIFFRCFERLNIFKSTIGDLEEILGDITDKLTQVAFDTNLSEEQKIQVANQQADNALRALEEQRNYEENAKSLFLLDAEKLESSITDDRNCQIQLLKFLILNFFRKSYQNVTISEVDNNNKKLKLKLNKSDKNTLLAELDALKINKKIDRNSKSIRKLEDYLNSEIQVKYLNFDPDMEAVDSDDIFVYAAHPLILIALSKQEKTDKPIFYSFKSNSKILEPGMYSYVGYEWEEKGYSKEKDIKIVLRNKNNNLCKILNNNEFEDLLINSEIINMDTVEETKYEDEYIMAKQKDAKSKLIATNKDIVNSKIANLSASYIKRIASAKNAKERAKDNKIKIMKDAEAKRLNATYLNKKDILENSLMSEILVKLFAFGTIKVE